MLLGNQLESRTLAISALLDARAGPIRGVSFDAFRLLPGHEGEAAYAEVVEVLFEPGSEFWERLTNTFGRGGALVGRNVVEASSGGVDLVVPDEYGREDLIIHPEFV
jgi:hypothetical protein